MASHNHAFLLDGRPGIQLADGAVFTNFVGSSSVVDGLFHHVAMTVDRDAPDGVRIWIDGTLDASFDPIAVGGSLSGSAPLVLGRRAPDTGGDAPLTGQLDEVHVFNRSLTDEEIAQLHQRCASFFSDGFESGDTGRWASSVGR